MTFLRCLNFLETPDEGNVNLGGELLSNASVRYSERELREKRKKFGDICDAGALSRASKCAHHGDGYITVLTKIRP